MWQVPWVLEQFVKRCQRYGKARIKLLSRTFVDHLYTHLMDDPERHGLITTGLVAVLWAAHSCKTVRSYGFGGGIDLIGASSSHGRLLEGGGVDGGGEGGGKRGDGGEARPAFYARYNYYSTHTDTKEHILWPWHEWDKENKLHNLLEAAGAVQRRFPPGADHHRNFTLPSWCGLQAKSCRLPS